MTSSSRQPVDSREQALADWTARQLGGPVEWSSVSADASARRYFRARPQAAGQDASASRIAVDSPPDSQNNRVFIEIADLCRQAGLHVPDIVAHAPEAGFLLLSDLGDTRYIDVLDAHNDDNADRLFEAALAALLDWQAASRPGVLPAYDRATLEREIRLFDQWYLPRVLGHVPSAKAQAGLESAYDFILERICAQPPVFVHRDYMPRNLMVTDPLPGVIDFQDARYGPASYDVISLFKDAFISWPEARVTGWCRDYWQQARARGVPVAPSWDTFQADLALTGAQRHLKIMGLFVRLAEQQGKTAYAADLGRFATYLAPVVEGFSALAPLREPIRAALAHHGGTP